MTDLANQLAASLIRNFNEVPTERLFREPNYDSASARLARGTIAQKLGASIDTLAPGKVGCPYHLHHAQEEMFVILEGSGTLRVAGEMLPLREGDVIFIPAGPQYPHQIINSSVAPLKYLSVSTQESPEICEYPDSGKFMAEAKNGSTPNFDVIQKNAESLDYWHRRFRRSSMKSRYANKLLRSEGKPNPRVEQTRSGWLCRASVSFKGHRR